jgi:hypothetical protein
MKLNDSDREELRQLEENLWREDTRFDLKYMESILADDFLEVGMSGRCYRREATLAITRAAIHAELPLADLQIRLLAPDVAQLSYVSVDKVGGATRRARRSSIWSRCGGRWLLRFHQGTPSSE